MKIESNIKSKAGRKSSALSYCSDSGIRDCVSMMFYTCNLSHLSIALLIGDVLC